MYVKEWLSLSLTLPSREGTPLEFTFITIINCML